MEVAPALTSPAGQEAPASRLDRLDRLRPVPLRKTVGGCGTLNYTHPDDQYFCCGCNKRTFDETTCWWALNPHPDDTSPWEIDMADPLANANNNAQ